MNLKKILPLVLLFLFSCIAKANIQDIHLDDSNYKFADSICAKYYSNNDSIQLNPVFNSKLLQRYKLDSTSFHQLADFLISFNRIKNKNFATKQWNTAELLAQKLVSAFQPELLKISKEYNIKNIGIADENVKNFFTILLLNTDFSKFSQQEIDAFNAGDVERMSYKDADALNIQHQLNFILHNSNYTLIK